MSSWKSFLTPSLWILILMYSAISPCYSDPTINTTNPSFIDITSFDSEVPSSYYTTQIPTTSQSSPSGKGLQQFALCTCIKHVSFLFIHRQTPYVLPSNIRSLPLF